MSEGYQPKALKHKGKLTPPNTGSHVKPGYFEYPGLVGRSAGRKMVLEILDSIEEGVNKYVNDFDPCPKCANKTEAGHKEICHDCAYFYPAKFKARRD